MGNTPTNTFQLNQYVLAKFDAGQQYYAGKIVRVHSNYAYDVQFFHSGRTLTKQWNDIKPALTQYNPQTLKTRWRVKGQCENNEFELSNDKDRWTLWQNDVKIIQNTNQNQNASNNNHNNIDSIDSDPIIYKLTNKGAIEAYGSNNISQLDANSDEKSSFVSTAATATATNNTNKQESSGVIDGEFFGNFDEILVKNKVIEVRFDNNNNNSSDNNSKNSESNDNGNNSTNMNETNKVNDGMVENFHKILTRIGGNEFNGTVMKQFEDNAHDALTRVFEEIAIKNEKDSDNGGNSGNNYKYISKFMDISLKNGQQSVDTNETIDENKDNSVKNEKFKFDLRMDLDFKSTVNDQDSKKRDEFSDEIKKEISNALKINESLIKINGIRAGSVIVEVIIICGLIPLVLAGIFALGKLFFKIKRKNKMKENKNKVRKSEDGEVFSCAIGDAIQVRYKGVMYGCKIQEIRHRIDSTTRITVEYLDKPFTFRNTETLTIDSDRIQAYPEPGTQIVGQLITSSYDIQNGGRYSHSEHESENEKEGAPKLVFGLF